MNKGKSGMSTDERKDKRTEGNATAATTVTTMVAAAAAKPTTAAKTVVAKRKKNSSNNNNNGSSDINSGSSSITTTSNIGGGSRGNRVGVATRTVMAGALAATAIAAGVLCALLPSPFFFPFIFLVVLICIYMILIKRNHRYIRYHGFHLIPCEIWFIIDVPNLTCGIPMFNPSPAPPPGRVATFKSEEI